MRRKTRGFTLVELTFVIVVMLILAAMIIGGAQFIMNQARGQTVVDQARSVRVAVESFMGRRRITQPPQPADENALYDEMRSYMGTSTSTEFQNPYSGGAVGRVQVHAIVGVQAPAAPTTLADYALNTDFPKTNPPFADAVVALHRGRVHYFYNSATTLNPPGRFRIWNGSELQEFTYYAVQAYDDQGSPLLTVGR